MIASPLTSLDLNAFYPPGLASEKGRARQSNGGWNNSRRRYPQGMRLPSSSYQTQNQYRRTSFSGSKLRSAVQEGSYQRTSHFDPFGDSNEAPSTQPTYTHYYYYDPNTNRPTLAYADEKNPVDAANLTVSTNILLDTLLNRLDSPRAPSPPRATVEPPPKSRSPSPPHPPRPRSAAISRPAPSIPTSTPTAVTVSAPPPPPIKVPKAQRDAIARVVASLLLNRADGVGRQRRRCSSGYVKSSLSRVVSVE